MGSELRGATKATVLGTNGEGNIAHFLVKKTRILRTIMIFCQNISFQDRLQGIFC